MLEIKPGRPLGPIAESIIELLQETGPLTSREIAARLQLSIDMAKKTCSRLEIRRRIRVVSRIKTAHSNKPVAKYDVIRSLKTNSAVLPSNLFK